MATREYCIAWWNVENLFNIAGDANRPDYLKSRLAGELKGWTADVLDKKLKQLTSVVCRLNDGAGPDLLGVCEVENQAVLEKWRKQLESQSGRTYRVAHHNCQDSRGIDVAFIYDSTLFTAKETFSHEVLKRSATRDLFQVNFETPYGRTMAVIGNHWPARSGGVYESEPYRILAGETLSYWIDRIPEYLGDDAPILVMGDFNDQPFDRSVREYALGTGNKLQVSYARSPRLYNLMWPSMGNDLATYVYGNEKMILDQFMVNKHLMKTTASLRVVEGSCRVIQFEDMVEGRYQKPRRFGRPRSSRSYDPTGFSDHLPIAVRLTEKTV